MAGPGGGACVVVGARESRAQGEGRQGTDRIAATEEAPVDSGDQADEVWLLSIQRKLYQWSRNNPEDSYGDLWNWVTDPRNLRCAWRRIARNKGSRSLLATFRYGTIYFGLVDWSEPEPTGRDVKDLDELAAWRK